MLLKLLSVALVLAPSAVALGVNGYPSSSSSRHRSVSSRAPSHHTRDAELQLLANRIAELEQIVADEMKPRDDDASAACPFSKRLEVELAASELLARQRSGEAFEPEPEWESIQLFNQFDDEDEEEDEQERYEDEDEDEDEADADSADAVAPQPKRKAKATKGKAVARSQASRTKPKARVSPRSSGGFFSNFPYPPSNTHDGLPTLGDLPAGQDRGYGDLGIPVEVVPQQPKTLIDAWLKFLHVRPPPLFMPAPTNQKDGTDTHSAELKKQALWTLCNSTPKEKSYPYPPVIQDVFGLVTERSDLISYNYADLMHKNKKDQIRPKFIHAQGVVATGSLTFTPEVNAKYTGLFKSNSKQSIFRLSSSIDPIMSGGVVAGLAVKALRTGRPSANTFGLHTPDPSLKWNYFQNNVQTHALHTNSTGTKLITYKSHWITNWAVHTGLSDFARYDEDGAAVSDEEINFPFQLIWVAPTQLRSYTVPGPLKDHEKDYIWTDQFHHIGPDSTIFDIYIQDEPHQEPYLGGRATIDTKLMISQWADQNLFFRHQIWEEDIIIKKKQKWGELCPDVKVCQFNGNTIASKPTPFYNHAE